MQCFNLKRMAEDSKMCSQKVSVTLYIHFKIHF